MSDNSHIDKIFKDGVGKMNFSNVDAMWQKMDAELDNDDKRKKRPVFYFTAVAVLLIAGFFSVKYFNTPAPINAGDNTAIVNYIVTSKENITKDNNGTTTSNKTSVAVLPDQKNVVANTINSIDNYSSTTGKKKKGSYELSRTITTTITSPEIIDNNDDIQTEELIVIDDAKPVVSTDNNQPEIADVLNEKIDADINPVSSQELKQSLTSVIPAFNKNTVAMLEDRKRRDIIKPRKIAIEIVAGRDFLRMNRKAGSYIGVRVNKLLDNGTAITAGVNYATHVVFDSYRLVSKPSDQKTWDARLNNIATVRVPIFLQRQMGSSKLSMMIGLVPTYITHAEVYNVPDSYTGNPEPFRKFTVNDLNRLNVLFGAGLKYAPTKWFAIELSGNYSLTGMVKDGYKNQSRVNDNFKSLQAGFAFRLW